MGKVEEAVRSAIERVVRRELRAQVAPLAKEVRELRRRLSHMAKNVPSGEGLKAGPRHESPAAPIALPEVAPEEVERARISATLIKKLRARLGITQAELGALIGITGPAVAQWETGSSEPRGSSRAALVGLRKLGRREVQRLLESKGVTPARAARKKKAAPKATAVRKAKGATKAARKR